MVGRWTAPTRSNQPFAVSRGKRTQATAAPCRTVAELRETLMTVLG